MKKYVSLLMLIAALVVPWASRAQDLSEYTFETGVDANKWITLSSSATQLLGTSQDDAASSITNIGFTFPFGDDSYTRFWVSSNGILSFNSTTSTTTTAGQFTSSYYNTAQPKICGVAKDLGTCSDGYIKYELTGTAPNRVLVVEFKEGYTYSASTADVLWQVQLHEDSSKVVIVYGPTAPATTPSSFQTGLGVSGSDFYTIDPSTHVATHRTTYYATTSSTWHGANRYYQFTRPVITCPKPTALTVSNITIDSAIVTWHPGGTESEWAYKLNNGLWETVYDTTVTFDYLTPNTPYTFSLRAVCGSDDTSNVATVAFRTACTPVDADSLPWTYGFEDASTSGSTATFNPCLGRHVEGSTTAWPYTSTTHHGTGSYSLYMYRSSTVHSWLTLPLFDEDLTQLQVSFYAYRSTTASYGHWVVGVMSDPNNMSTFDTIASGQVSANSLWELVEVPLNNYTGNGQYIAILCPKGSAASYTYIDDITVGYLPSCVTPTNIDTLAVTGNSADITWTSSASEFIVEYGLQGFAQGTGDSMTVYTNAATLTNLQMGVTYGVYVTAVCGSDTSNACFGTFATGCSAITAADLPYTEGFESYNSGSSYPINSCWRKGTNNSTAYPYPTSTVVTGQRSLYFYGYWPSSSTSTKYYCWAALPPVDENLAMNTLQLNLKVKRGSSTGNTYTTLLYIGVADSIVGFTSAAAIDTLVTWVDTLDYFSAAANSINNGEVSFANYTGTGKYVVIYAPIPPLHGTSTYCYNYAYVDDVVLRTIPTCYEPTSVTLVNATSDGATLSWTPDSRTTNPNAWNVEYGVHGFNRGNGTTETVTATTITLTGLNPNTEYDVYISADCGGGDESEATLFTFRTECSALTTLPYTEDFESYGSGTTAFPTCWHKLGSTADRPYINATTSYGHNNSHGLYFYAAAGGYCYGILPSLDSNTLNINTLQVSFWARQYSTSYNCDFEVGVMTNPTDASTFTAIGSVHPAGTTYEHFEVALGTYTGTGTYIAFRAIQHPGTSTAIYLMLDDVTLEPMPACPAVTDLDATTTVGAALLTWDYQSGYEAPAAYEVTYDSIGGTNPATVIVTEPTATITGLQPRTDYKAYVKADCGTDGYGHMDSVEFTTGPNSFIDLTNGTASTSYYIPIGNFYKYSYTQQIVTAAEMGGAATLTGIDFQYSYSSAMTSKTNVTIYLANTTTSSLSSAFVTYNASTFVQVYTGSLNCTQGWNHFQFTTPFQYDGTSNLLIVVHDNSNAYNGSSYIFATHSAPAGTSRYVQNDSNPYTLSSISGGTSLAYRANMHIYKLDNGMVTCANPAVRPTYVSQDTVELAWIPGYNETEWNVDYRVHGTTTWTNAATGVSATTYTVDSLTPGTDYDFRVSFTCTDDNTLYAGTCEASTPCVDLTTLPFTENFDGVTGATSTSVAVNNLPNCWNYYNVGTSTSYSGYPMVYNSSSYAHSGSQAMRFYTYTTSGTYADQYAILPKTDATLHPVNTLQVSFWMRSTSTSYASWGIVGVMTDPTNASTFVPVDTVYTNSSTEYALHEVAFNHYTGAHGHVALKFPQPSSSYNAGLVDDITLDVIPTCPHVTNVVVDTASENSITISWHPGGTETQWSITDGADFYVTTYDTSYTVTGLYPNTLYNLEVRALCDATDSSHAMNIAVRTACAPITVPFIEDFESYGSGSTVFPACWYKQGSTADRPYIHATTSYGHNNTHGLYFYAAAGGYCYAIMPPVNSQLDITTLEVTFWARQYSTSYNCDFVVGVMTDPTDVTTFVSVDTVHPAGTTYEEFTVSLANYTGAGNHIAFSAIQHPGTSTAIYMMLDDVEVYHSTNCPSVEGLYAPTVSNNNATVAWTVDGNAGHTGVMLYLGTVNNIAAATDSVFVPAGTNSYTFTGLHGTTTYYVWARTECATESARVRSYSFTTTADCVPVSNVTVAGLDYTAFGLRWDAPTAGNAATAYRVYWKATTATTWDSMVVTTPYCYISGLTVNTNYQYRILTMCNDQVSEANSGTIATPMCGTMVTEGGASNSYLPTYVYYNYSYTQQIYLAEELGDIDTIGAITYYYQGTLTMPRSMTIYMANTNVSSFGSSADYVPASALTQVFNGTMSGTGGWITFTLTTPFVRTPGSNLVIACNDLTGDYETSASWNATATSTTRSLYYYWDDDPFSPAAPDADASNGVLSYVNQIVLTKPNCSIPTCGTPIIFVDSTTTTAAYISWSVETGHTYEVAYRATGDTSWTVVATANTTGSYAITGLTPSSEWDVRVSTVCDGATLTGTATVQTLCAPMPLPLTEDFEDRANGVFERHCWTVGTTNLGTTNPMPIVVRLQGSEDRICLIYNGGYVILPEVAEELDSLQIRFKLTQGGENVRFLMGLMLDPAAPINSIHVLDTLIRSRIDSVNSEVNITYQFAGHIPTGYEHAHIAFWDAFNDNYSFLNDIVVEYVPHCTPASDFTVDTVTTTTATISWTNPGTNATSYVVEYGPRYYTPGNGTRVSGTGSPFTITGLAHSTSYDAYVYTVCGATGDTSIASSAIRFTTACAEITTLPYVMNFENGIVPPGSNPTDALPNCWTASGSPLPHVIYTSTGAYTGTASHCFQFNAAGGVAALPQMQPAINTLMMSFRAHNASPANAGLVIGTLNSANTFVPYDTVDFVGGTNNVYNVACYFNDYVGNDTRIAMRSLCSSTSNYIYIDDIVVDTLPACIPVSHLHAEMLQGTSAYIVWSRSTATSYTVRYKLHSAATYTDTTTTTRDITLLGLTPQTQYDVMVIGSCNDTATLSFTTPCNAVTLPYTENFDTYTTSTTAATGVQVNCWDAILTGTSSYQTGSYVPQIYYSSTYAHSGNYSYRLYGVGYHMMPPMPVALDTLELKFWARNGSTTYGLEVGVMEGTTFIPIQSIPVTTTQTQYTVYFGTYHGNSRTIAFRNYYTTSTTIYYANIYLDDIQVDFVPSCMPVANVHSVGASTSTIDVDWTDMGTPASQWEVNYGTVGHAAGSGQTITVSSHPVTITGLDTLTNYDVYVRALCSATDQSSWSEKATLSTAMCEDAAMYVNNTTGSATTSSYAPIGYSTYNYSYVQTIVDSAVMAQFGGADITGFGFFPTSTSASTYFNGMTVYMANVPENNLASAFITPNTTNHVFVKVIDNRSFNYSTANAWQYQMFDTVFTWDGHSNVLFAVKRDNGSWSSGAAFAAHSVSGSAKARYIYQDSGPYSITSPGAGTAITTVGDIMFVACGVASCPTPGVTVSDITYQSATVTATGAGVTFELAYGTDPSNLGTPQTNTTGVFNLTGLSNNTEYFFAMRQQCEDGNWSQAFNGNFTTVDLPCTAPSNLTASDVTFTGATVSWTPGNRQERWEVHFFEGTTTDRYDTVNNPTITFTGLVEGTTYNVAVRGFCTETEMSDWSDTLQVTTLSCVQVTDVTVSNVTSTSATLTWPATGATSYIVEYGYHILSQGEGQNVTVNTNSCTLTGLDRNQQYDVFVRGVCDGTNSVWSDVVTFTTTSGQGILDADAEQAVVVFPNPASELVTIMTPAASTVTLVDLNGRQSGSWYSEDGNLTIDVSDLAKGAYFVRVTTAEGTAVRKLIVK